MSIKPFAYDTTRAKRQFSDVVATIEGHLVLARHQPGDLDEHTTYIYRRTSGSIGSLTRLIRKAAALAIESGREQITRELMDVITIDVAAEERYRKQSTA